MAPLFGDKTVYPYGTFVPVRRGRPPHHNGEDHLEAAVANILSSKPPYLDRSVYYDRLTRDSAETLQNLAREAAMKALRQLNRKALEMSDIDKDEPDAKYRINFGAYFYTDADLTRKDKG